LAEPTSTNILITTADATIAEFIKAVLASKNMCGSIVGDADAALTDFENRRWEAVIIDLAADGETTSLVRRIKQSFPGLPVLLISDDGSLPKAEQAMLEGCTELLSRPIDRKSLESFLQTLRPAHQVLLAGTTKACSNRVYQIAGNNEKFLHVIRLARKVAPTSASVLITGESGTGKELISHLIHGESNRANEPFVHVNCAALSETLLESELFGHEKGAFTGAHRRHKGRFERAHGGTLLLDEISETTPKFQAELLRVLEQQDFERVGGSETVRVNVRVISTSNRNLSEEVERGTFRRDLFYRIGEIKLDIPPLRERKDDIEILVWHFVNMYAAEARRDIAKLDEGMMELLRAYHWPGNVRQLRNVIRAALILGEGPVLSLEEGALLSGELQPTPALRTSTLHLRELERQAIIEALRRTKRNQAKAAQLLGITDRTLREKLRRYREADELQTAGEGRW